MNKKQIEEFFDLLDMVEKAHSDVGYTQGLKVHSEEVKATEGYKQDISKLNTLLEDQSIVGRNILVQSLLRPDYNRD